LDACLVLTGLVACGRERTLLGMPPTLCSVTHLLADYPG